MSLKSYLGITGVIGVIVGLPFILFPTQSIALYGMATDPAGLLMTRYFGAAFLSFGVLLWFVREAIDPDEHRFILMPLAICAVVGFVISLVGQFSGVVNPLGWLTVAIFGVIGVGFWWFSRG